MGPSDQRPSVVDAQWMGGLDSYSHPSFLAPGQYAWAVNVTNRGGTVQTRPGRSKLHTFLGRRAQGVTTLLTIDNDLFMAVAIDGMLYSAPYPFTDFTPLSGVSFSPDAERVYFATAVQAADYKADGTLAVLPRAIRWLVMQDGLNSPAWWDGSTAHQPTWTTSSRTVPTGTAMASSNGRLWVAQGQYVFASDYVIPLAFRENTYLAGGGGFQFPSSVTVLAEAPQDSGLFVFTERSVHTLQSTVVDRTKWQSTSRFQADVTLEVGCVSPFGFCYQHGLPWFFSHKGLLSMDRAQQGYRTDRLVPIDAEMNRSKDALLPHLSNVCLGTFDNVLLASVPSGSIFNRHTWILDGSVAYRLQSAMQATYPGPPVWSSVWTGTFPVQYANVLVQGVERLFELSYSGGTISGPGGTPSGIHLWEDFQPTSDDAGTPIRASLETRLFVPLNEELCRVGYVDVHLHDVWGAVSVSLSLAGMAGLYRPLGSAQLAAPIGPLAQDGTLYHYKTTGTPDSTFQSFKRQNRYVRTPENVMVGHDGNNVETGQLQGVDRGFQVKLEWSGRASIRAVRIAFDAIAEAGYGRALPQETVSPSLEVFDA